MRQTSSVLKLMFAGLFCLTFSVAVWAENVPALTKELLEAVKSNNISVVRALVDQGADPSASGENGISAVDFAVDKGFFDIAHFLLAAKKKPPVVTVKDAEPSLHSTSDSSSDPGIFERLSRLFVSEKPAQQVSSALDELEVFEDKGQQKGKEETKTAVSQVSPENQTPQPTPFIRELIDEKPEPIPFVIPKNAPVSQPAIPSDNKITRLSPPASESTVDSAESPLPTLKSAQIQQQNNATGSPNTPSLLDQLGDFFSSEQKSISADEISSLEELERFDSAADAPNENNLQPVNPGPSSKPLGTDAASTPETNSFNPFTKLTDIILELLPDAPANEAAMDNQNVPAEEKSESDAPEAITKQEELAYEVEDLTVNENPYKVVLQPLPVISETSRTEEPHQGKDMAALLPEVAGPVSPSRGPTGPIPRILTQADLLFGERGRLDEAFRLRDDADARCVIKEAWNSRFCIEDFQWPEEIIPAFGAVLYFQGGGRAIVHYQEGKSAQYHGLFPTESFGRISEYFIQKLGTPTEAPEIWSALLAEPQKRNRTFRWFAKQDSGPPLVMEIREIDDLRWSAPPDKANGVIRLYKKGADPVFRLLTMADLLLLQVQKGSLFAQPDMLRP